MGRIARNVESNNLDAGVVRTRADLFKKVPDESKPRIETGKA